jgi:hypothetical protein
LKRRIFLPSLLRDAKIPVRERGEYRDSSRRRSMNFVIGWIAAMKPVVFPGSGLVASLISVRFQGSGGIG